MHEIVAPLALGILIGGMGLFSLVVAPTAFRALPVETAGRFVRGLFPHYYLFVIGAAAFSAVALVGPAPYLAAMMIGVTALGLLARQVLMPRINALRDRQGAGDAGAAKWFGRLHGVSVAINLVQFVAALAAVALYV
ncbi:DUF4149 domain-containing protein [Rubrimonas cliftonensis]|uniref:TMEM205-like domain-containing protein n=1 Tax=Rubrimonas cliftonensis TaxID=89524 RepID=A0A1H3ZFY2_9RHOB|nr:DUF4149 domain-containing protein [Rubrimonas cliftonensis]SEA22428.1 protein of unknown function [Rubrimonas cliftonensis]